MQEDSQSLLSSLGLDLEIAFCLAGAALVLAVGAYVLPKLLAFTLKVSASLFLLCSLVWGFFPAQCRKCLDDLARTLF